MKSGGREAKVSIKKMTGKEALKYFAGEHLMMSVQVQMAKVDLRRERGLSDRLAHQLQSHVRVQKMINPRITNSADEKVLAQYERARGK